MTALPRLIFAGKFRVFIVFRNVCIFAPQTEPLRLIFHFTSEEFNRTVLQQYIFGLVTILTPEGSRLKISPYLFDMRCS